MPVLPFMSDLLTCESYPWKPLERGPSETALFPFSVKRYIRKGIPLEHRARVWMGVSGAQARMDRNPGYYQRLLQGERSASLEEAIRTGDSAPGLGRPPGWGGPVGGGASPRGSVSAPRLSVVMGMRKPTLSKAHPTPTFSKDKQNGLI